MCMRACVCVSVRRARAKEKEKKSAEWRASGASILPSLSKKNLFSPNDGHPPTVRPRPGHRRPAGRTARVSFFAGEKRRMVWSWRRRALSSPDGAAQAAAARGRALFSLSAPPHTAGRTSRNAAFTQEQPSQCTCCMCERSQAQPRCHAPIALPSPLFLSPHAPAAQASLSLLFLASTTRPPLAPRWSWTSATWPPTTRPTTPSAKPWLMRARLGALPLPAPRAPCTRRSPPRPPSPSSTRSGRSPPSQPPWGAW